jgi:hypothetical protein
MLEVGLWIAEFALEIPARHLQFAQERANGWIGPTFEGRNGLAMDRARLDEPGDPEMGGSKAVWESRHPRRLSVDGVPTVRASIAFVEPR